MGKMGGLHKCLCMLQARQLFLKCFILPLFGVYLANFAHDKGCFFYF